MTKIYGLLNITGVSRKNIELFRVNSILDFFDISPT